MPETTKKASTNTNWQAFVKAGLVPTTIKCSAYHPVHQADMSCHTRLLLSVPTISDHIKGDHGGGFKFSLKTYPKAWQGWADFEAAGLEIHDIRCDVCDQTVPLVPARILFHMRPHTGKVRRIRPGGEFLITIRSGEPLPTDDATAEQ